jgi:hypothetical protein
MPTAADITVKKNDGSTDVTYTVVVPSAGDKSPAVWRSNTVGSAIAHKPELRVTSRSNGDGTARRVDVTYGYPQIVTSGDTGVTSVENKALFTASGVLPVNMTETDINEFVSQGMNLMASALMKAMLKAGYAAS